MHGGREECIAPETDEEHAGLDASKFGQYTARRRCDLGVQHDRAAPRTAVREIEIGRGGRGRG
jgi:hypothetical protein